MEVKTGVQAWSSAPQPPSLGGDARKTMSAAEKQNVFGDQDIGEVLNKVADPNWIDPSRKARNVGGAELGKDAFLNLLLTQMKHQDPTNPLKSHEMAAQLAQFTSLEKLTNIDESIGQLVSAQQPAHNFEALNMIGKSVSGDSSHILRSDDRSVHEIKFQMGADAQAATVNIRNMDGELVRTLTFRDLKQGENEFVWNGLREDGTSARAGEYYVEIDARGSNGSRLHAETKYDGVVTGVNFTAQGPVLLVGNKTIPMSEVRKIVDPQAVSTKAHRLTGAELPPVDSSQEEVGAAQGVQVGDGLSAAPAPAPKRQVASGASLTEDVAMSREVMNELEKAGAIEGL